MRDVLTLDVEVDPSSISRVRDQFRSGLSNDLTGSLPGIVGGPYGGMGPTVPGFPGGSTGQMLGQALFPGYSAPPNAYVADFEKSSAFFRERAFGDFAFNAGRTGFELGSEVMGGGLGAAAGGGLGYMFGGKAGGYLGAAAGGVFGATMAGGAAGMAADELQNIREGNKAIQDPLVQLGYKAGLNILGEDDGADKMRQLSYQMGNDASRNPLVAMTGMDPRKLVAQVVQSGLQNNMYGQIDGGDVDSQLSEFRDRVKKDVETTVRVVQALHVTVDEARSMMADMRRAGSNDPEQMAGDMGLLASSFQFGTDPSQLATVKTMGSGMARQAGLPGFFGGRETTIQALRLAEQKQAGFIDPETWESGGGAGNLAGGIQAGVNRQLQEGGVLRNLLFASMSEGGGIDTKKFRELSGRSALDIGRAAAQQFYSGGDPLKKREDFNYNMPDLLNQLSNEDPGAVSQALRLQVDNAAKIQARISGRPVTNATRFQAAQQFYGLDQNQARAFAQSSNASQLDDPLALIDSTFDKADKDLIRRADDPGVKIRMLTSGVREDIGAPLVEKAEGSAAELQRYFGKKLKSLASVLGEGNLSPEDRQTKMNEMLTQYNKELQEGDPTAPAGSAARGGLKGAGIVGVGGGKDALSMLAGQGGSVITLLNDIKTSLSSFLTRAKGSDAQNAGGLNSATKTKANHTSPSTGS